MVREKIPEDLLPKTLLRKQTNDARNKFMTIHNSKIDEDHYLDMIEVEEPKVAQGFDRGLDFEDIKTRLLDHYNKVFDEYNNLDTTEKFFNRRRRMKAQKLMYLCVALIGLRNGSRNSESVEAFKLFINKKQLKEPVVVKIAKSQCKRFMRRIKEYKITSIRYRKIYFPNEWINIKSLLDLFYSQSTIISNSNLQKRVLDYLLYHFQCNTHSLRYCFINHLLYKEKIPLELVSKIVGHKTQTQILTYVQNKNSNDVLENIFKK